jgi:hypothetical protein
MTTLIASVSDATKLDGFQFSVSGDASPTWMYTEIIEKSVTVTSEPKALNAADYPLLAAIWDNEEDAVYDEL